MTDRDDRGFPERSLSRRGVIAGVGSGLASGVALSGCLSLPSDDPPPIGIEKSDLEGVAAIELPEVNEELPVGIGDDHVDAGVDRVESLLASIPADLATEIPNEAVRNYVTEQRERARESLESLVEQTSGRSNYSRLSPLLRARRHAAEAEGAYAAAVDQRHREDVYEEIDAVERRAEEIASELTRTGKHPRHALVVYRAVEARLRAIRPRQSPANRQSTLASEVVAVGESSAWLETRRARVETVDHLVGRQAGVGETTFDEAFERAAEELLDGVEDRASGVPSGSADAGELFDAPVEGTPRDYVGEELARSIHGSSNGSRDQFENGWLALSLASVYRLEHELRTLESIRSRIQDGELDRPDGIDEVREAKRTAITEVQAVQEGSAYPFLVQRPLGAAIDAIERGEWAVEHGYNDPDTNAVRVLGGYELAAEFARTAPETAEWLVESLSGA